MNGTCSKPGCGVADGVGCENGEPVLKNCPHYLGAKDTNTIAPETSESPADEAGLRLPWTGRALGVNDLILASARSQTELIALVGPYNAGKTALLTALFVRLAKAGVIVGHRFAGSFSLEGWARLRDYTKWPDIHGHSFPPHTPDSNERVPSLLHVAFRRNGERIQDFVFTDAPGEWFTRWLNNRNADDASGARWIVQNATQFVYTVDRAGLAGKERGLIRHRTQALARMLAEHRAGRPVLAAWTKSDDKLDTNSERPVRAAMQEYFGDHPSMDVSVYDNTSVELLAKLLRPPVTTESVSARLPQKSAFFAYNGGAS